jgi:hypothetical protein
MLERVINELHTRSGGATDIPVPHSTDFAWARLEFGVLGPEALPCLSFGLLQGFVGGFFFVGFLDLWFFPVLSFGFEGVIA